MSKGRLLAVCVIWLVLIGMAAVAWRMLLLPRQQQRQAAAEHEAEQQRRDLTSSPSAYDFKLHLGLDSFSGYAVFRTPEFRQMLSAEKIGRKRRPSAANACAAAGSDASGGGVGGR